MPPAGGRRVSGGSVRVGRMTGRLGPASGCCYSATTVRLRATAVRLPCDCRATAVRLPCDCGATAVRLRCDCGATAVRLTCNSGATRSDRGTAAVRRAWTTARPWRGPSATSMRPWGNSGGGRPCTGATSGRAPVVCLDGARAAQVSSASYPGGRALFPAPGGPARVERRVNVRFTASVTGSDHVRRSRGASRRAPAAPSTPFPGFGRRVGFHRRGVPIRCSRGRQRPRPRTSGVRAGGRRGRHRPWRPRDRRTLDATACTLGWMRSPTSRTSWARRAPRRLAIRR